MAGRILRNSNFLFGLMAMAAAFYSLLFGLSWADVSLVAPASASLTFVTNAIAANFFLHERVDHFRWVAAILVAAVWCCSLPKEKCRQPGSGALASARRTGSPNAISYRKTASHRGSQNCCSARIGGRTLYFF